MNNIIGAQLYGYRDECETLEGLDVCLRKISEIGYKAIQVSGLKTITDGKAIKKIADKYGLEIYVTHVAYKKMIEDFESVVQYQKDLGCNVVGIGCWEGTVPTNEIEEAEKYIESIDMLCKNFAKEGLTLAYHNHAIEFEKLEGKYLIDHIMEKSGVTLILDTYWSAFAGVDPVKFIEKYKDRISYIHYKDLRVSNEIKRNTVAITSVGNGNLDWDAIIEASKKSSAIAAIVEQDKTDRETPYISGKMSYDYLAGKGFI